MARAYSIWLVVRHDYEGYDVEAAFTVKHEMLSFLKGRGSFNDGCGVLRLKDGEYSDAEHFSVRELLSAL